MNELLTWLRAQQVGVRTCTEFQERALALRAAEPQQAALLRLLADLAGRFVDRYYDQPLSIDVAARALDTLTGFVTRAVDRTAAGPGEMLALLNEIGTAELA